MFISSGQIGLEIKLNCGQKATMRYFPKGFPLCIWQNFLLVLSLAHFQIYQILWTEMLK